MSERALESRDWGNFVHKWVETGEMHGDEKKTRLLEKKLRESGTVREEWWPEDGQNEIALAYNIHTGEAQAQTDGTPSDKDGWKASFDVNWIVGTLDYTADLFGTLWVDDLKTGRLVSWEDYEAQQQFYCGVWGLVSRGEVVDTRSTLTHWPKYPVAGKPTRFGKHYEAQELNGFLDGLKVLAGTVYTLNSGPHCKFCPSRYDCEAYKENENG